MKPKDEKIRELLNDAQEAVKHEDEDNIVSYYEGVVAGLSWILGDTDKEPV